MNQDCGIVTNQWIKVKTTVLVETLVLVQALVTSRSVVACSEHAETESYGAPFGEAADKAVAVLPTATLHAAATVPPSIQSRLPSTFFFCGLNLLGPIEVFLHHSVSFCLELPAHAWPSWCSVPAGQHSVLKRGQDGSRTQASSCFGILGSMLSSQSGRSWSRRVPCGRGRIGDSRLGLRGASANGRKESRIVALRSE